MPPGRVNRATANLDSTGLPFPAPSEDGERGDARTSCSRLGAPPRGLLLGWAQAYSASDVLSAFFNASSRSSWAISTLRDTWPSI